MLMIYVIIFKWLHLINNKCLWVTWLTNPYLFYFYFLKQISVSIIIRRRKHWHLGESAISPGMAGLLGGIKLIRPVAYSRISWDLYWLLGYCVIVTVSLSECGRFFGSVALIIQVYHLIHYWLLFNLIDYSKANFFIFICYLSLDDHVHASVLIIIVATDICRDEIKGGVLLLAVWIVCNTFCFVYNVTWVVSRRVFFAIWEWPKDQALHIFDLIWDWAFLDECSSSGHVVVIIA